VTHAEQVAAIVRAAVAEQVLGVGVAAAGPVVDPVGLADPLTQLPDWLAGHVSFLRGPLDALRGDPDEINGNAATLRSAAREMHAVAEEQANDEMVALAMAIDATATITVVTGKLVHVLRGVVFGMVAALVTDLARGALLATATAAHTSGGSIAVFTGSAHARALATARRIRGLIATLMDTLDRQTARLTELDNLMSSLDYGRALRNA
jgi:hypothetical protein